MTLLSEFRSGISRSFLLFVTSFLLIVSVSCQKKESGGSDQNNKSDSVVDLSDQEAGEKILIEESATDKSLKETKDGDIAYLGEVKFDLLKVYDSQITGLSIEFKSGLASKPTARSEELSASIKIKPAIAFSARWNDHKTLVIDFEKTPDSKTIYEINVEKLPLGDGKNLVLTKESGNGWKFETPGTSFLASSVIYYRPFYRARLRLKWNAVVNLDAIKKEIQVERLDQPNQKQEYNVKLDKNDPTAVVVEVSSLKDFLKGRMAIGIGPGAGEFALPKTFFDLESADELKVWQPKAISGTSNFKISFRCRLEGFKKERYWNPDPPCRVSSDTKSLISVEPAVPFTVLARSGMFVMTGDFKPQTEYKFRFGTGLRVGKNHILPEDKEFTVATGDLKKSFTVNNEGRYFPFIDDMKVSYKAVNAAKVNLSLWQVYKQNIIFWLAKGGTHNDVDTTVADVIYRKEIALPNTKNKEYKGRVDLSQFQPKGTGVYQVYATGDFDTSSSTFIVTDIAPVIKKTDSGYVIWTRSLNTLEAKPNVKVSLYTKSNREISSCVTRGPDASCEVTSQNEEGLSPFAFIFTQENDLSFAKIDELGIPHDQVHAGTRSYQSADQPIESFVYGSRKSYRPGETVELSAIVQSVDHNAVSDTALRWVIQNPKGKIVSEITKKTSDYGLVAHEYQTNQSSPTGKYTAMTYLGKEKVGQYEFLVEEFVPERLSVRVDSKKNVIKFNERTQLEIKARYLFGGDVSGGNYKLMCQVRPAFTKVPKNPEYVVGPFKRKELKVDFSKQDGKLNKEGVAKAYCDPSSFDLDNQVWRLNMNASVSEAGSGRFTKNSKSILIADTNDILGVKLLNQDKDISFEVQSFDLEGNKINKNEKVIVKVYRIRYEWYYESSYYSDNWRKEEIFLEEHAKTVALKEGRLKMTLPLSSRWSDYMVQVSSLDSKRLSQLKTGWNSEGTRQGELFSPTSPIYLPVKPSKKSVSPGEKLQASFSAPFSGWAHVTIESNKVHSSQWIEVKKGPNKVDISSPEDVPNFYISVMVVKKPIDAEGRFLLSRAWGSQSVSVLPKSNVLDVNIARPETIKSNSELVINVSNQQKEEAEYSIAIVDEGIHQLTRYTTPSPIGHFFQPRQLGVNLFEGFGWTFSRDRVQSQKVGGDAALAQPNSPSMPVRLVSFWKARVKSDSSGRAQLKVRIPQFQGKLRVVVVGATDSRVGSQSEFVTVKDPLILQTTLPRFLSSGDRFEIPVFLVNGSEKEQKANVELKTSKNIKLATNRLSKTLKPGESTNLIFAARVESFSGRAKFSIKASSKIHEAIDDFDIPIHPSTPKLTIVKSIREKSKFSLASLIPPSLRDDGLAASITLASLPHLDKMSKVEGLVRYPYGCVEQTTSSTMPLLFVRNLLEFIYDKDEVDPGIDDMVNAGLSRLASMQTPDGGLGYWPGDTNSHFWGTAYASMLILEAKKAGYKVSQSFFEGVVNYLHQGLLEKRHENDRYSHYSQSLPLVLYVLASVNKNVDNLIKSLINNPKDWGHLKQESLVLLGAAAKIRNLSARYQNTVKLVSLDMGKYQNFRDESVTFWAPLRSLGLILSVLMDNNPNSAQIDDLVNKVAAGLGEMSYLHSQSAAWAIMGLGKYLQNKKKANLSKVQLLFAGKAKKISEKSEYAHKYDLSSNEIKKGQFSIKGEVENLPSALARFTGYSKLWPKPNVTAPVLISRKYYNFRGEPVNLNSIQQGELIIVQNQLTKNIREEIKNFAYVDRLPAGFEIENPRLSNTAELPEWIKNTKKLETEYVDIRDDRIAVFGNLDSGWRSKSSVYSHFYIVRAVTSGQFTVPPAKFEQMYKPENFQVSDKISVTIKSN